MDSCLDTTTITMTIVMMKFKIKFEKKKNAGLFFLSLALNAGLQYLAKYQVYLKMKVYLPSARF